MNNGKKRSSSERLQQRLEDAILNREYKPGGRLPSERKIMADFTVGRGTVREAYRALQQKGLIDIRQGGGAFVKEVDSSLVGDTLSTLIRHRRISSEHLQEFREAIDSRCAAYAAERATEEQITELKNLIGELESLIESPKDEDANFYALELDLHIQLAKISGNPMFEWFSVTVGRNAAAFSEDLVNQPGKRRIAVEDWRSYIRAVEKREITKAAMIMRAHIIRFGEFLQDAREDG